MANIYFCPKCGGGPSDRGGVAGTMECSCGHLYQNNAAVGEHDATLIRIDARLSKLEETAREFKEWAFKSGIAPKPPQNTCRLEFDTASKPDRVRVGLVVNGIAFWGHHCLLTADATKSAESVYREFIASHGGDVKEILLNPKPPPPPDPSSFPDAAALRKF
jgi:hypothetical protein